MPNIQKGVPAKVCFCTFFLNLYQPLSNQSLTFLCLSPPTMGMLSGLAYKFGRLNAQELIYYKNYISKMHIFAGTPFMGAQSTLKASWRALEACLRNFIMSARRYS